LESSECNKKLRERYFIYRVAAVAAIGGFLFGFDTGIISGALIFVEKSFALTTLDKELVVSSVVLGAFFSALFSGRLADYYGRRNMLLGASVAFIIGTAVATFATHVDYIIIGRFILGMAIGISSFTVPLFISEMAPPDKRGRLVLLNAITITGGEAIAFIVDYALVPTHSWRLMFATGFIPAIALFFGMLFLPSTPRWLSLQGLKKEARSVLQRIRNKENVSVELEEIRQSLNEKKGTWTMLLSKRVRPVLIIGLGLGILQQFVGINTVMYYGPFIFKAAGFQSTSSQILATFGMGVVNTIISIVAVFIIDKCGRRPLLLSGLIVAAVSLAFVGALFHSTSQTSHVFMLIFMVAYIAGYAISIGSLFWLIIAEIYPLEIRGLAMSVVTSAQWLANFVVAMTFLSILSAAGPSITFWIYGIMCILGFILCKKYIPETKNISLEHIEKNLNKGLSSKHLGA
jgi:MFS transporter, SP family, galactose:H+ symporter